jgi:exodeoxyribonuclease-3
VERAKRQLAWLIMRDEQVLVLTETKASAGCRLLADSFADAGYAVHWPVLGPGEYGTMIVATVPVTPDDGFGDRVGYLPARAAAVTLAACDAALAATVTEMPAIVLGDLNVLEPSHRPAYPFFEPFEYDFYCALATAHGLTDVFRHLHPDEAEYSWVGRAGDGYRYDHAFCCRSLAGRIAACDYLHQPRFDGLSDHSALTMHLGHDHGASLD